MVAGGREGTSSRGCLCAAICRQPHCHFQCSPWNWQHPLWDRPQNIPNTERFPKETPMAPAIQREQGEQPHLLCLDNSCLHRSFSSTPAPLCFSHESYSGRQEALVPSLGPLPSLSGFVEKGNFCTEVPVPMQFS